MKNTYLSYLMGAVQISDEDLIALGVEIEQKKESGSRALKIPSESLGSYSELIKDKLENGFWNEVVGAEEIIFLFKFKDSSIKEYKLSPENEQDVSGLCAEFSNESIDKTANVYKYISENEFYHDFMMEHYSDLINRNI